MRLFGKKQNVTISSIKSREESDALRTIRFQGPLGSRQITEIQKWVTELRAEKDFRFKPLLLDFKDVPSADSSAVAQLVVALFEYKSAGRRVALINLRPELQNILDITRVNRLIRSYATEHEAISDITGPAGA